MNKNAKAFVAAAIEAYGPNAVLTRDGIDEIVKEKGVPYPFWLVTRPEFRAGRGQYRLPDHPDIPATVVASHSSTDPVPTPENFAPAVKLTPSSQDSREVLRQKRLLDDSEPAVPTPFTGFVPFGFFKDLKKIISQRIFYPVFITGLSGNGKTLMVEQVCSELKRELIRVNISIETDETDLIGGPTLVDGNVVYRDGPVITCMKRGAVLLIDEVDRGSNKLMCIQGILEGKPYYNKKSGELIVPAPGFTIIATANSKGQGNEEGKYLSQILDDAFLERFPITVEQDFPDVKIETKILTPLLTSDPEFPELLVRWADVIRKTYKDNGINDVVSTRRLVHIAKAFNIFGSRMKSINLCLARFDKETQQAFADLYTKVDETIKAEKAPKPEPVPAARPRKPLPELDQEVPF